MNRTAVAKELLAVSKLIALAGPGARPHPGKGPMKLRHYHELNRLRTTDRELAEEWAKIAAENLGGTPMNDFGANMRWLDVSAQEGGDEAGVTEEVNFVLDIVLENLGRSK